jgi:tRNA (guanine-N7-)-methyltransferase
MGNRLVTNAKAPSGAPWRNFYGRRQGKGLRRSQVGYMAEDLGELSVPNVGWDENPNRDKIDPVALFETPRPVWLEIGFGGGEHMVYQAASYPDVGIIGCEPYINGIAMLLGKIRKAGVRNVAIHPGDARDLFDVLPKASIDKAFLLYPDPWPKARHHRRRFVNPEFLDPLADAMKSGAELRVATDIEDYVRQTLEQLTIHPAFEWLAEGPDDWRKPWHDWVSTRYELKAIREDRTPHYLTFRRV